VDHRPGAPRHQTDPPRDETPRRGRTGHRPPEGRAPPNRNYLKGRDGDRANPVLAAAGYNFALLLRWLERLLRALIRALLAQPMTGQIA
jgi:IS5 family transposase